MSRRGLFTLGAARLVPDRGDLAAVGAAWRTYHDAEAGHADVTEQSRAAWGEGDPHESARFLAPAAEALVAAAGVAPGDRVLDAGAGTGNVASAAGRAAATVTALDFSSAQIVAGRARCASARARPGGRPCPPVDWVLGDVEAMPFADASFDRVLSGFGAMFSPRPRDAARELARVARPGATVALACWSSTGFMSRVLALAGELASPPAGVARPARWGRYESAFLWLDAAGLQEFAMTDGRLPLQFPSPDAAWEHFAAAPGPFAPAARAAPERARAAFAELLAAFDRSPAPPAVSVPATYVIVTARAPAC